MKSKCITTMFDKSKKRIADFAFFSLGAVSIFPSSVSAISYDIIEKSNLDNLMIFENPLNTNMDNLYAAHRSHRSHSSHRSHYSSRTSGYTSPRAVYSSPSVKQSTVTSSIEHQKTQAPKKNKNELANIVSRVQIALLIRKYDPGAIDGMLGSKTRNAIKSYQTDKKLSVTGTMTTETLVSLSISLR